MKKAIVTLILVLVLFNVGAGFIFAAVTNTNVSSNNYYIPYRNEYRLDYWNYPTVTQSVYVQFTSATNGQVWSNSYSGSDITGIFYLTCTGTYSYNFLDGSGNTVGSITGIDTTEIVNGSCQSYAGGKIKNDLNLQIKDNGDGTNTLNWTPPPGTDHSEIYKDGQQVTTTTGSSYTTTGSGSYTVRSVDSSGNTLGESDANLNGAGGCDACLRIQQMLSCPSWADYMGSWSNMIKNSVPPAPDWNQVAGIMRDTIVPAMAKSIGDDLQAREKPAPTPGPMPEFSPSVPTMTDLSSEVTTDLGSNVPDYTPDYSQSAPVPLTDPQNWQPDNTDKGYGYPTTQDLTSPVYNRKEQIDPDKGYSASPTTTVTSPAYNVTNTQANAPAPSYSPTSTAAAATPPPYNNTTSSSSTPPPYNNTTNSGSTSPPYVVTTPTPTPTPTP